MLLGYLLRILPLGSLLFDILPLSVLLLGRRRVVLSFFGILVPDLPGGGLSHRLFLGVLVISDGLDILGFLEVRNGGVHGVFTADSNRHTFFKWPCFPH